MDTKSLNDVLPSGFRIIATVNLSKVVDRKLILQDAKQTTMQDVTYSYLTLFDELSNETIKTTANQAQIAEVVKYLLDQKALPVYVKVINYGKSYAMVDPTFSITAKPANPG